MEIMVDTSAWIEYLIGSKKGLEAKKIIFKEDNSAITINCCLAELKEWALKNNKDFDQLMEIIRSNSSIIEVSTQDWIKAAEEKVRQRIKKNDFGIIDAVILVKQKQKGCKLISTDHHFIGEKNTIIL